jgi:hypothetical protein
MGHAFNCLSQEATDDVTFQQKEANGSTTLSFMNVVETNSRAMPAVTKRDGMQLSVFTKILWKGQTKINAK